MTARRVAVVITRLEGGAGVWALRAIRAVPPEECEVTLVCGSGGRLLDEAVSAGVPTVVEPSLRPTIAAGHDLLAWWRLCELFDRERFDVVHTHCAKAGAVGRLAARRCRTPRIVHTFHGFPFHDFQRAPRHRGYVEVERRLGRMTDVALCVGSGVAAEAVRRRLIAPERVRTVGVPVDRDTTRADPRSRERARLLLGLSPESVVVGAVGRWTYQKAPEDFAAAVRALGRPVEGVWIGGRPGPSSELLSADVPVRWVEDREDVAQLLPAFDVFALPSRYEGLPLAVVEAMVCGVPVVATAVNAVPDVVLPGETGLLVPPERPELLASAIAHLLDHPERAARMAARARERVPGCCDTAALARSLTAAYLGP